MVPMLRGIVVKDDYSTIWNIIGPKKMTFKCCAIDFKYQCRLTWLQETSVVVEQYLG